MVIECGEHVVGGRLEHPQPLGSDYLDEQFAYPGDVRRCRRGTELVGATVGIAGDHLTGEQYATALGDALGEEVVYRPLGWDDFRAQGFPGAVEMGNMFQYYAQNSTRFVDDRDLAAVRALNPGLLSFRDWLALPDNGIRAQ